MFFFVFFNSGFQHNSGGCRAWARYMFTRMCVFVFSKDRVKQWKLAGETETLKPNECQRDKIMLLTHEKLWRGCSANKHLTESSDLNFNPSNTLHDPCNATLRVYLLFFRWPFKSLEPLNIYFTEKWLCCIYAFMAHRNQCLQLDRGGAHGAWKEAGAAPAVRPKSQWDQILV